MYKWLFSAINIFVFILLINDYTKPYSGIPLVLAFDPFLGSDSERSEGNLRLVNIVLQVMFFED